MRFAKAILAAVAVSMSVAPLAATANDIRPGNSLVSASAASATPVAAVGTPVKRTGAPLTGANSAVSLILVAIIISGIIVGYISYEVFTDDEPESP